MTSLFSQDKIQVDTNTNTIVRQFFSTRTNKNHHLHAVRAVLFLSDRVSRIWLVTSKKHTPSRNTEPQVESIFFIVFKPFPFQGWGHKIATGRPACFSSKQSVFGCMHHNSKKDSSCRFWLKKTGLCLANNLHFKMDKLSKDQKDEFAVSYAILALYDGGVSDHKIHFVFSGSGSMRDAIKTP